VTDKKIESSDGLGKSHSKSIAIDSLFDAQRESFFGQLPPELIECILDQLIISSQVPNLSIFFTCRLFFYGFSPQFLQKLLGDEFLSSDLPKDHVIDESGQKRPNPWDGQKIQKNPSADIPRLDPSRPLTYMRAFESLLNVKRCRIARSAWFIDFSTKCCTIHNSKQGSGWVTTGLELGPRGFVHMQNRCADRIGLVNTPVPLPSDAPRSDAELEKLPVLPPYKRWHGWHFRMHDGDTRLFISHDAEDAYIQLIPGSNGWVNGARKSDFSDGKIHFLPIGGNEKHPVLWAQ